MPVPSWFAALAWSLTMQPPSDLAWSGREGCPSDSEVRRWIAELRHHRRWTLVITAKVEAIAGTQRLRLVARFGEGDEGWTRELEGASCPILARAFATLAAMELDARVREQPEPASPPPVWGDWPERPRPRPPLRRWHLHGVVRTLAELGSQPGVAGGLGVGAGIGGERFRVEFATRWLAPSQRPVAPLDAGRIRIQQWSSSLSACAVVRVRRTQMPSCLGMDAGIAFARGVNLDREFRTLRPIVATGLDTGLSWGAKRGWSLGLRFGVAYFFVRPEYYVVPYDPAFRPWPVRMRFALELRHDWSWVAREERSR